MSEVKIRPVRESDLSELAEIYARVYADNPNENWTSKAAFDLLSYLFKCQPELAFVAEVQGELAGAFLVGGIKPWWDGKHLVEAEIFVAPEHQKKGVGSELAKVIYRKALEDFDVKFFEAITFSKTKHPLQWYLGQGFEEISELMVVCGDLKKALEKLEKNSR